MRRIERAGEMTAERLAAVRGTWRLRSRSVALWLLGALRRERDPEVRVALAVNVLATAGRAQFSWPVEGDIWLAVRPVLRDTRLPDPAEEDALRRLQHAYEQGEGRPQDALSGLSRFWDD